MTARDGERGVSLVEVVVALAIIAIALLSMVGVVMHTSKMKESERELNLAKQAATRKLEEIKAATFSTVSATFNGQVFNVTGLSHPNGPGMQGFGTVTIDATNTNLLDITVRIQWVGVMADSEYSLRSLYTR